MGYLVYAGWFLVNQRRAVFPRHRIPYDEVLVGPPQDAEVVWIELVGGERVETWLLQPLTENPTTPAPLAIVSHGNGEVIDRWPWKAQALREMGFAVLLVEYPGYGRSEGFPTQAAVTEVLVKSYDLIVVRDEIDSENVLLVGRSLGAGAVCALATKRLSRAMILISPFTSIGAHATRRFLPPFFALDPFDNLETVRGYEGPVLIVHGGKDRLNPLSHAKALHSVAKEAYLLLYPDSAHHDCPPDWFQLWEESRFFLRDAGFPLSR